MVLSSFEIDEANVQISFHGLMVLSRLKYMKKKGKYCLRLRLKIFEAKVQISLHGPMVL
jgi:hypothetical protein